MKGSASTSSGDWASPLPIGTVTCSHGAVHGRAPRPPPLPAAGISSSAGRLLLPELLAQTGREPGAPLINPGQPPGWWPAGAGAWTPSLPQCPIRTSLKAWVASLHHPQSPRTAGAGALPGLACILHIPLTARLPCCFSLITRTNESHGPLSEAVLRGNPETSSVISIAFHSPPVKLKIMELCKPLRLGNKGAKSSNINVYTLSLSPCFWPRNWSKASRLACWITLLFKKMSAGPSKPAAVWRTRQPEDPRGRRKKTLPRARFRGGHGVRNRRKSSQGKHPKLLKRTVSKQTNYWMRCGPGTRPRAGTQAGQSPAPKTQLFWGATAECSRFHTFSKEMFLVQKVSARFILRHSKLGRVGIKTAANSLYSSFQVAERWKDMLRTENSQTKDLKPGSISMGLWLLWVGASDCIPKEACRSWI